MVIRDAQISLFDRSARSDFVGQLASYIRTRHGNTVVHLSQGELLVTAIPPKTLESLIEGGIDRASAYGMSWQSALASFVATMFVVAPNFDEDTHVHALLSDDDIEANYRMDSVKEQISEDHWKMLRQTYDAGAWGSLGDG